MNTLTARSSTLDGNLTIPPSKSHTLRAIWFASMAKGTSIIHRHLPSPDTEAMIAACQAFGAHIVIADNQLKIRGVAGQPQVPKQPIDCRNSGQVLRYCTVQAALLNQPVTITGDHSICHNRPIHTLIDAWREIGLQYQYHDLPGYAPITLHGPLQAKKIRIDGQFAQPVTACLMLACFSQEKTQIEIFNLQEPSWVALTGYWLDLLGIEYDNPNPCYYQVTGRQIPQAFEISIPGDYSSAAFVIAAALITKSAITLSGLAINDAQGDKAFIDIAKQMGANISYNPQRSQFEVQPSQLCGGVFDISDFNDAIAAITVIACYANSPTRITGAENTRHKESNRIVALQQELSKMGAHIETHHDGLTIHPRPLKYAQVMSHHDHRIGMALAVASLGISDKKGATYIQDCRIIAKSFPQFAANMQRIGANIQAS